METLSDTVNTPDCPFDNSSIFSRLTFAWTIPLLKLGTKKSLHQEDIYKPPSIMRSDSLATNLSHLLSSTSSPNNNGSLLKALWKMFGWRWMAYGSLKLGKDLISLFILIYLLPHTLFLISSGKSHWLVLQNIAFLFSVQIIGSFAVNTYFFNVMTIGCQARVAITNLLFRKGLALGHHSKNAFPSSTVIYMIAGDVYKIEVATGYMHYLWSGIILIVAIIWFLKTLLGWLPITGILVLLIMIPVQSVMVKTVSRMKGDASSFTDRRLKGTAEMVEGIRLIKFYSWVDSFYAKISDVRMQELGLFQRLKKTKSLTYCLTLCLPTVSVLATFAIYLKKNPNPN